MSCFFYCLLLLFGSGFGEAKFGSSVLVWSKRFIDCISSSTLLYLACSASYDWSVTCCKASTKVESSSRYIACLSSHIEL